MAGHKNKGKLHGIRPKTAAPNFKKGEKRTIDAAKKGGQARKEQFARFKTMREAAEALRDIPAFDAKKFPNMTNGVAAVASMFKGAQAGNPKAFHELSLLMGELVEKVQVGELPTLVDDVPRAPDPAPPAQDDAPPTA